MLARSCAGTKALKPIPKFESEDEERGYWATHDSTDHIDWTRAKSVPSGRGVVGNLAEAIHAGATGAVADDDPPLEDDALALAADQVFLELDGCEDAEKAP